MQKLPDFEALAIFAKIVDLRSFGAAATELGLSRATVSKAINRLEDRLGARLFNRTSRRSTLTEVGRVLAERAAKLLADGEAAESAAQADAAAPRGLIRLTAPMSFGLIRLTPLIPEFLAAHPDIQLDLHLSDATVDIVAEGFDIALRIAVLPDSSLRARRLCDVRRHVVAAPAYFARYGRPSHPAQLGENHRCLGYAYLPTPHLWRFQNTAGEEVSVRLTGPLRANNGDALVPALLAGQGVAVLPDFIVAPMLREGLLEEALSDWNHPVSGIHLVTPPGGPRPHRVDILLSFLADRLGGGAGLEFNLRGE